MPSMKVRELVAALLEQDQDADVFASDGAATPQNWEVFSVEEVGHQGEVPAVAILKPEDHNA